MRHTSRPRIAIGLVLALAVLMGTGLAHAQPTLWGSSSKAEGNRSGTNTNPSSLFKIDAATGLATLVGASGLGNGISAIRFDPTSGTLYGILGSSCSGAQLITINQSTGAGTVVGALVGAGFDGSSTASCAGGSDALVFAPDGTLYAGGWNGGSNGGKLLKVDKNTGAVLENHATPVNSVVSFPSLGFIPYSLAGLAFDPSGTLWASHGNNDLGTDLHTVDPATGSFTSTLHLSPPTIVSDLSFAADGTLYASLPDSNQLATIDTTTGAVTAIGAFGEAVTRMSGLAFEPPCIGTRTFAQSAPDVIVPATGSASIPLGNIEIDECSAGVLANGTTISVTLPDGLTFISLSAAGENGLTIGEPSPDGDLAGRRMSFKITAPSTAGAGKIVVSRLFVAVPNPALVFCPTGPAGAVCVDVSGSEGSGLTPVPPLKVATITIATDQPTVTELSVSAVGVGVTRNITLTGMNFLASDAISFVCHAPPCGAGITVVPGSVVVSGDGKSVSLDIEVAADAQTGLYDVVITRGGQLFTASGKLTVNPAPTVTSAGTEDGTEPLLSPAAATPPGVNVLKGQTVLIRGTGFLPPTTVPSDLKVSFSGSGLTVTRLAYDSDTQISVDVDVTQGAESLASRMVTVVNPDLGTTTSGAVLAIALAPPTAPVGQSPTATSGTTTTPPAPQVSKISPLSGPTGFAPVTISGKNFSSTLSNNLVTFTRANNLRTVATITSASTSTLKVIVPANAVDGSVTVAVNGVQQSTTPINFTVTNPTLRSAQVGSGPAGAKRGGPAVTVDLFGTKFASSGVTVALTPSSNLSVGSVRVVDSTHLSVTVSAASSAVLGLRDITVTNPDGASSTLPQSFGVNGQFDLALSLSQNGSPINAADFSPSVVGVQVTVDKDGKCTARSITPTVYTLTATFPGGAPPGGFPPLTFALSSSRRPGTATNDDCEPNLPALPAESDFSIGLATGAPNVAVQQVSVSADANGVYTAKLASWDWGGTVSIAVANSAGTIGTALNLNRVNGVLDGTAKLAADGLTDFEKQRGVYLVAPAKAAVGQTRTGLLQGHVRLDVSMRNLFVRGLGFSNDPTLPPGKCGVNSLLADAPVPATVTMPCPMFKVGHAFANAAVRVWDATGSFDAAGTTVFPTRSLADPLTKPMLDLATVKYDAANCSGGTACDHTSKLGPRQSSFPTLGFSTFGTASTYGTALVLGIPFKAYFLDRPYLHQENVAGKFLPKPISGPTVGRPMLAPITVVCDQSSGGQDDGNVQTGECAVNGVPGGDVYQPVQVNIDNPDLGLTRMTTMDANNDGCVELPFVADPRILTPCNPNSPLPSLDDSATAPQATFQQVVTRIITHELGHATGINIHTSVASDLMYMYSINWTRDDFSSQAAALIQIHNKGQQ